MRLRIPCQKMRLKRGLAARDNRIDKKGVRWVSYHFQQEAEKILADYTVRALLDEAERDNT
jgi:hypothetical protein